jgi:hypothetical protein
LKKASRIFPVHSPVLYSHAMTSDISAERLERLRRRLLGWATSLHSAGLDGLAGTLLGAAAPLSVLGAQVLWVAQPVLGLVVPRDEIGDLAHLLSDPEGVAWLREILTGEDT